MRPPLLLLGLCAALAAAVAPRGGGEGRPGGGAAEAPAKQRAAAGGEAAPAQRHRGGEGDAGAAKRRPLRPARCPAGVPGCRAATGRIVYVERVDPDGDGDAHFVILDRQGITLPGLTAIDVRPGLRPRPLPGLGTLVSAAGPVQTGSYGQRQIHALELRVAGR